METKILLIEDNLDNLDLMIYLLNRSGYKTLSATDGEMGLDLIKKENPDLIICDIQLPKKDGYVVVKELKSGEAPYNKIPIIAITAYAMVGDKEKIIASGYDDYIPKPIDPTLFVSQIEKHLDENLRKPPPQAIDNQDKQHTPMVTDNSTKIHNRGTVLVVEDKPENQFLYKTLLNSIHVSIISANNSNAALNILRNGIMPDLILTDVHLPDMDGLTLVETIKNDLKLATLPIILISSSRLSQAEIQKANQLEVVQFIIRPIDPKDFLEIMEKVLDKYKTNSVASKRE